MAIFFYTTVLAISLSAMLIAAANAFTLCVAVPAWRSHSILAPVAALVIAGFTAAPLAFLFLQLEHHMFLFGERFPFAGLLFGLLAVLALALVCAVAWAATILCRAVLEFLPPLLTKLLSLKTALLLQGVLLVGAVCSAAVQLASFGALAYLLRDKPALAVLASITGLAASAICLRVLLQLHTPDPFAPKPVPQWIKSLFLQPRPTDGSGVRS